MSESLDRVRELVAPFAKDDMDRILAAIGVPFSSVLSDLSREGFECAQEADKLGDLRLEDFEEYFLALAVSLDVQIVCFNKMRGDRAVHLFSYEWHGETRFKLVRLGHHDWFDNVAQAEESVAGLARQRCLDNGWKLSVEDVPHASSSLQAWFWLAFADKQAVESVLAEHRG